MCVDTKCKNSAKNWKVGRFSTAKNVQVHENWAENLNTKHRLKHRYKIHYYNYVIYYLLRKS